MKIPLRSCLGRCFTLQLGRGLLLLGLVSGCAVQVDHESGFFHSGFAATVGPQVLDKDKLLFHYQVRDGQAALESERAVLVFHGFSPEEQQLFHFQDGQQAVQVNGPGKCFVSTTCASGKHKVTFRSDYVHGTNTLEFGAQRVLLTRGGRLLVAGEQAVDLSAGRKVIHLDGQKVIVQ